MLIESVTANGFGPLCDQTLTLGPAMTVVIGDNESAKSTWHAAIYSALCGRRRAKGKVAGDEKRFADLHKPWDGRAWVVSAVITLGDNRRIEIRQDLAGKVDCYAKDRALGRDVSGEVMYEGMPDASGWLGLDRRSFAATACVYQSQLLGVLDGAQGLGRYLERAAATAGVDATATEALGCLDAFHRDHVGRDQANTNRPLRAAHTALEGARIKLDDARLSHDNYLASMQEAARLRRGAEEADCQVKLYEAATAWQSVERLRSELEDVIRLDDSLGGASPPSATTTTAVDLQVERALSAWQDRPEPVALSGHSSDELRQAIAQLPAAPHGPLTVGDRTLRARDALGEIDHAIAAHQAVKPHPPAPGGPAGNPPEAEEPTTARIQSSRRLPVLLALGVGLALGGLVLTVLGVRLAALVALIGVGMVIFAARTGATPAPDPPLTGPSQARFTNAARAEHHREQTVVWDQRYVDLARKRQAAQDELEAALIQSGAALGDDLVAAFEHYKWQCESRAATANQAGRRAGLEAQLSERSQSESLAKQRQQTIDSAGAQVIQAAQACGEAVQGPGQAAEAGKAATALKQWQMRRREDLLVIDDRRRQWAKREATLKGRTTAQLGEELDRAIRDLNQKTGPFTEHEVAAVANKDVAPHLPTERAQAIAAREQAATAEGALQELARTLPSVADAEVALAWAETESARVEDLDWTITQTRSFLAKAQEKVQGDIAPVLAATLSAWLPRITGGRYVDAIVDPACLAVEVSGPDRRFLRAESLSHGTAEQIYLLLRMALARHLTTPGESCPLLLDDVTVHADATRTVQILALLHEVSREQQVVVFSQERLVADWARSNLTEPYDCLVELPGVGLGLSPPSLRPTTGR